MTSKYPSSKLMGVYDLVIHFPSKKDLKNSNKIDHSTAIFSIIPQIRLFGGINSCENFDKLFLLFPFLGYSIQRPVKLGNLECSLLN